MTPFRKKIIRPLKNRKGFTLVELVVVIVMVSILSSIAIINYIPLKRKALDATAYSDTRNLVKGVLNAMLATEDVDYNKVGGGAIGDMTITNPAPREPVFVLSPGVEARIGGASNAGANGDTFVQAFVYHTSGTPDASPSGKKEYMCIVDESAGTTIVQ